MSNLTDVQQETFDFLNSYIEANGQAPLLEEMAVHFKITKAAVVDRINPLIKKGLVRRTGNHVHRNIEIVGKPMPSLQDYFHYIKDTNQLVKFKRWTKKNRGAR